MTNPYAKYVTPAQPVNPYAKYAAKPAPVAPAESREDELRRKAQEDIVAGMGVGERTAASVGRGMMDTFQAAAQLNLKAMGGGFMLGPGLLPIPLPASVEAEAEKVGSAYDKTIKSQNDEFEAGLGKTTSGFLGRLGGNIVSTAPLAGPAAGGSFLANVGKAALSGGAGAVLSTPVTDGAENFVQSKLTQAAVGAGTAGGLSGVLQGLGKAVQVASPSNLVKAAYNFVGKKAANSPEAIAAEAAAKAQGVPVSTADLTGSPMQKRIEQFARESPFTQDIVLAADMKRADKYAEAIGRQIDKLGKGDGTDIQAGNGVRESIKTVVKQLSDRRSALAEKDYALVDRLAGETPAIAPDRYREALTKLIEENSVAPPKSSGRALADSLKAQLGAVDDNAVAKNALKTRQYLSKITGGIDSFAGEAGQPNQHRAAVELLKALDDDIAAAEGAGGALGDALKLANGRYRAYSQRIDQINSVEFSART